MSKFWDWKKVVILFIMLVLNQSVNGALDLEDFEDFEDFALSTCNCSIFGRCQDGLCVCSVGADGPFCDDLWKNDPTWYLEFEIYCYTVITLHTFLCIFSIVELVKIFKYSKKKAYWRLPTFVFFGILLGSLGRILYFLLDPHDLATGVRIPVEYNSIIFNAPIVIWLDLAFFVALYWIELQKKTGLSVLKYSKLRYCVLICLVVLSIALIIFGFFASFCHSTLTYGLYNSCLIVSALTLICIFTICGIRLFYLLKGSNDVIYETFLKKVTRFLFLLDFSLFLLIGTLVFFTISSAWELKNTYLVCLAILRTLEGLCILAMLLLLSKKKPKNREAESTALLKPQF